MKIDKNTLVALFIEKNGEVVFKNREYFSEKDKVKKIVKLIYFKKSPNENVEVNIFLAVESWSLSKCISSNHPSRSSVMNEMIGDGFSFLQNEN
jgi:hypothetical protein